MAIAYDARCRQVGGGALYHHSAAENVDSLFVEIAPDFDFSANDFCAVEAVFAEVYVGGIFRKLHKVFGDVDGEPPDEDGRFLRDFARAFGAFDYQQNLLHSAEGKGWNEDVAAVVDYAGDGIDEAFALGEVVAHFAAVAHSARGFDNHYVDFFVGLCCALQKRGVVKGNIAREEVFFLVEFYQDLRGSRNVPRGQEFYGNAASVRLENALAVVCHWRELLGDSVELGIFEKRIFLDIAFLTLAHHNRAGIAQHFKEQFARFVGDKHSCPVLAAQ